MEFHGARFAFSHADLYKEVEMKELIFSASKLKNLRLGLLPALVLVFLSTAGVLAQEAATPTVDTGDTAWMLTSSALVLMMTIPGLFLFYGGLLRAKNTLGTIMQSFIIVGLISIQWVLWGYSLAFGPDKGGIIGSLAWFGLKGVGLG